MTEPKSPPRALVIDDSKTVLLSTRALLEAEGYAVECAETAREGIEAARRWEPHCILLDYFLPDRNAPEVVSAIRAFDTLTQIVLVTGRAADRPAREMMRRLDIQGYHDKRDGSERLMVWIDAALNTYRRSALIARQGKGTQQIITASDAIHRLQPLEELLPSALEELARVLDVSQSSSGTSWDGLLVTMDESRAPALRAGIGQFAEITRYGALSKGTQRVIARCIIQRVFHRGEEAVAAPICHGGRVLGVVYIEGRAALDIDEALVQLFLQQVALSMENVRLYEMATRDTVTGLYSRAHLHTRLLEHLKRANREGTPLALICLDVDQLKPVNDTFGHRMGDALLKAVGASILDSIRESDAAGRVGGDEFVIILTSVQPGAVACVAERVRRAIAAIDLEAPGGRRVSTSASLGSGVLTLDPSSGKEMAQGGQAQWNALASALLNAVDAASYEAKAAGGDRCCSAGIFVSDGDIAGLLERLEARSMQTSREEGQRPLEGDEMSD